MTADFHNPISRAIRSEDTSRTVSRYRNSQERSGEEYACRVRAFYDPVTEFYELGWGRSFHFASGKEGESFEESLASHQYFLGEALGLKPGMKVLDVGCGVGGPQRAIAGKFQSSIVGLNINRYQIGKCAMYNRQADLAHLCRVMPGDFMDIPAGDGSFDAAYHIEAIAHAPDKKAVYAEIFRILRPGALFAGYDWCMTPSYDCSNPEHLALKRRIEYGNALPQIASFGDVTDGLKDAGFEVLEAWDRAPEADSDRPWYRPLEGRDLSLRSLQRTAPGRRITTAALHILEAVHTVPKGSREIQEILNIEADNLVAAGRLGIFTPMFYHKARKPF